MESGEKTEYYPMAKGVGVAAKSGTKIGQMTNWIDLKLGHQVHNAVPVFFRKYFKISIKNASEKMVKTSACALGRGW